MLYTKKGDNGQTENFNGDLIDKDDLVLEVLGSLDEVGAFLAICKNKINSFVSKDLDISSFDILDNIQNKLFLIQSSVAGKEIKDLDLSIREVEISIDLLEDKLKPLNKFLKVGGSELVVFLNYERTLIRKTERRFVALDKKEKLENGKEIKSYLNRLSDLFFVMSRFVNYSQSYQEEYFN